jgi:lipopolysaccharide export system protein LptA
MRYPQTPPCSQASIIPTSSRVERGTSEAEGSVTMRNTVCNLHPTLRLRSLRSFLAQAASLRMAGKWSLSVVGFVAIALSLASSLFVAAQPRPAAVRVRPRVGRKQAPTQPPIQFGDVTVSNFKTGDLRYSEGIGKIDGANSTVEAVDPNHPEAKTRLQASQFLIHLSPKNLQQVERVEAIGNVRYSVTRPADGGGTVLLRGTGTKGTYWKQEGRMRMDGPVNFYGEQPTRDGKAKQSATGTASVATYDQEKQILSLSGGVNLKLVMPGAIIGEAPVHGDTITIEMASRPYNYHISNDEPSENNIRFKPANPKPDEKAGQKPDKKSP